VRLIAECKNAFLKSGMDIAAKIRPALQIAVKLGSEKVF